MSVYIAREWLTTFSHILSRLQGFVDDGNGRGHAVCPCNHPPDSPADLWLAVGDKGNLIMKCYPRKSQSSAPRCDAKDILSKIGLPIGAIYQDYQKREQERQDYQKRKEQNPNTKENMRKKPEGLESTIVAYYDYEDVTPDGKTVQLFQVIRKRYSDGSKDFPQRHRNPKYNSSQPTGENNRMWVWSVPPEIKRVLYCLPQLRKALKERPERYVFIVEGEEDVKTAHLMKLTATCNAGGAGKWNRDGYDAELVGCNVVLIPDEDAVIEDINKPGTFLCPGIDHVRGIAKRLLGKAKSVRVLRLPEVPASGDLSDWFGIVKNAGKVPEKEFRALMGSAVVIESEEDIVKIVPRGESVWPIPAGQWCKSLPKPEGLQSGDGVNVGVEVGVAPVGNDGAVAGVLAALSDLRKVCPNSASTVDAWVGQLWFAVSAFQASLHNVPGGDYETTKKAALYLAAQLIRGLDAIPEFKSGG